MLSTALALCDWSDLQKTRRGIIRSFLLMKSHSHNHESLDTALTNEMNTLMAEVRYIFELMKIIM